MLNKVHLRENRPNGKETTVIIGNDLLAELETVKYTGGFLRFNFDVIDEVEGKRQSIQEKGKLLSFLTQIL